MLRTLHMQRIEYERMPEMLGMVEVNALDLPRRFTHCLKCGLAAVVVPYETSRHILHPSAGSREAR